MSVARLYRVGTPFNGVDLPKLDFEQSASLMYFATLNQAPVKLTRSGHTSWSFSTVTFGPTISAPTGLSISVTNPNQDAANSGNAYFPQPARYVVTSVADDTGQESRASSKVSGTNDLTLKRNKNTLTWSAVTGAARYKVYKADNTGDFGYIGTTTDVTFTDDNIGPDYSEGPPQGYNPFAASGDYPSTVTFFEQRLLYGRTSNNPNAIYGSRTGEFENFDISRPLRASDSFTFGLVSGRVNAVNQLASTRTLLALTSDSIFQIEGGQAGYISSTDFVSRRQNGRGASRLSPLIVDSVVFYQTSVGNTVRTLGYEFQSDSIQSNDVTIFSPHLFRNFDIVSWAYAQEPRSLIWAARNDGKLLCFTWEQDQQVWGWTLCETDGLVKSVAVISENGEDRLYLLVARNGKLLIERMASAGWTDLNATCFMDSAVSYSFDTPSTVLRNLDHLEGKSVVALADGVVVSGLTVTGGIVTLPNPASMVTCGLPYTATVETLPLAIQGQQGWTIAKPQQIGKVVLRVIDSRGFYAGPTDAKLTRFRERDGQLPDSPPTLFSGLVETYVAPEISDGVRAVVQSSDPLPLTLTGVYVDPRISA